MSNPFASGKSSSRAKRDIRAIPTRTVLEAGRSLIGEHGGDVMALINKSLDNSVNSFGPAAKVVTAILTKHGAKLNSPDCLAALLGLLGLYGNGIAGFFVQLVGTAQGGARDKSDVHFDELLSDSTVDKLIKYLTKLHDSRAMPAWYGTITSTGGRQYFVGPFRETFIGVALMADGEHYTVHQTGGSCTTPPPNVTWLGGDGKGDGASAANRGKELRKLFKSLVSQVPAPAADATLPPSMNPWENHSFDGEAKPAAPAAKADGWYKNQKGQQSKGKKQPGPSVQQTGAAAAATPPPKASSGPAKGQAKKGQKGGDKQPKKDSAAQPTSQKQPAAEDDGDSASGPNASKRAKATQRLQARADELAASWGPTIFEDGDVNYQDHNKLQDLSYKAVRLVLQKRLGGETPISPADTVVIRQFVRKPGLDTFPFPLVPNSYGGNVVTWEGPIRKEDGHIKLKMSVYMQSSFKTDSASQSVRDFSVSTPDQSAAGLDDVRRQMVAQMLSSIQQKKYFAGGFVHFGFGDQSSATYRNGHLTSCIRMVPGLKRCCIISAGGQADASTQSAETTMHLSPAGFKSTHWSDLDGRQVYIAGGSVATEEVVAHLGNCYCEFLKAVQAAPSAVPGYAPPAVATANEVRGSHRDAVFIIRSAAGVSYDLMAAVGQELVGTSNQKVLIEYSKVANLEGTEDLVPIRVVAQKDKTLIGASFALPYPAKRVPNEQKRPVVVIPPGATFASFWRRGQSAYCIALPGEIPKKLRKWESLIMKSGGQFLVPPCPDLAPVIAVMQAAQSQTRGVNYPVSIMFTPSEQKELEPLWSTIREAIVAYAKANASAGIRTVTNDMYWNFGAGAERVRLIPQVVGPNGQVHPALAYRAVVVTSEPGARAKLSEALLPFLE